MRACHVYILSSLSRCICIGVTNDLLRRLAQLNRWPRARRNRLIERENPGWHDLAASWKLDE